jgi:predicted ATPase
MRNRNGYNWPELQLLNASAPITHRTLRTLIDQIAISGYRSIKSILLRLGQLNIVTGANGSGKSNVYRALKLIADAAAGRLAESLAREGGFSSVRWAGQRSNGKEPVSLRLGFSSHSFTYCLDLGLPIPSSSAFSLDPEMKRECVWNGPVMDSKSLCADRRNSTLRTRAAGGRWTEVDLSLSRHASMLSDYADPFNAPELIVLRESLRTWRFYDTFRVDSKAPARRPSIASFTPVMSGDGSDMAAALQTIIEIGDHDGLYRTIDDAFPGSRIRIETGDSVMQVALDQPGILRVLTASELSDGTLRFLLLVAAMLTPRPPELMVLNEPENSLHPDLLPALARLIQLAAENSQVIVVSHNPILVRELEQDDRCIPIKLEKDEGATVLQDGDLLSQYGWKWPSR